MIKMTHVQGGTLTPREWWELSKEYEAIISILDSKSILRISDGLSSKLEDPVRMLYYSLISEYHLNETDYKLDQTVYGTGIIFFPSEKKMEILEMIDHLIDENPIF